MNNQNQINVHVNFGKSESVVWEYTILMGIKKVFWKVAIPLSLLQKHFIFFDVSLTWVQAQRSGLNTPDKNCQMCSDSGCTCQCLCLWLCVPLGTSNGVTSPHSRNTNWDPCSDAQDRYAIAISSLTLKKYSREASSHQVKNYVKTPFYCVKRNPLWPTVLLANGKDSMAAILPATEIAFCQMFPSITSLERLKIPRISNKILAITDEARC